MHKSSSFSAMIATKLKLGVNRLLQSKVATKPKAALRALMPTKLFTSEKTISTFLSKIKKSFLLAFFFLIYVSFCLSIIAASQPTYVIGSHGNLRVEGVGVYNDANCSIAVKYLDWGTLEPGSAKNVTLYIRNEGNQGATLFLATNNWNPVNASSNMALTWNYNGKMLSPMENTVVTLTLSVFSTAAKNIVDFSFDIIIGIN